LEHYLLEKLDWQKSVQGPGSKTKEQCKQRVASGQWK